MPKGSYKHAKTGPSMVKNQEAECKWCGKKVYMSRRKSRAVCMEWECQSKEEQELNEIKSAYRKKQIAENQKKKGVKA